MLAARLARDALWDAEVCRQAQDFGLPVMQVDGTRSPDRLAAELARQFRLARPEHQRCVNQCQ